MSTDGTGVSTVRAYVSLGSNIARERNIREAVAALTRHFGALAVSPVYASAAVGFEGEAFYNLVVAFNTTQPIDVVQTCLRGIETAQGRHRGEARFAPRTLDLDLLLYGDVVREAPPPVLPRPDILEYPFVLRPLADLAPDTIHPLTGVCHGVLWREMAATAPALTRVPDFLDT
jgi:2-amino-4-hydroxy-6-hydroxymethyldihydropteridine diphosphokinase